MISNFQNENQHPVGAENLKWAKIRAYLLGGIVFLLILLFLRSHGWAQELGMGDTGNQVKHVICDSGCSSSSSPSYGSAFPATGTPIGFKQGANLSWGTVDGSNNLNVNCIVGCSASTGFPASLTATGSITSTQTVSVSASGAQTVLVVVSGTWTGTLQPKITVDGTNLSNVGVIPFASAGASVTTITANGNYWVAVGGANALQIVGATVASGTAVVSMAASPAGFGQLAIQSTAANLNATVVQATGSNLHVNVDSAPTTAVTGTFFQTTQPVSIASMPSTPVTGTFFQATQPVSGTVTAVQGTGSNLHVAVDSAPSTPVTNAGTFAVQATQAGTWNVVLGAETTKVIGTVNVAASQTIAVTQATASSLNDTDAADGSTGSAVPAKATYVGTNASGNLTGIITCDHWKPFSLASTTALKIVTLAASKQVYICSINIVSAGANNVALVEGTKVTTDCDTSTAGLAGGATAATGWNFAANGGLTQGSGVGVVAATATVAHDVCLFASAVTQVSGVISWTQF